MSAVIWMMLGIVVLAVCCGGKKGNSKPSCGKSKAVRIDHLHYYDPDDYECSVCGARFGKNTMVCPRCGARFTDTERDTAEFEEEMNEEEDWDEDHDDD